MAKKKSKFNIYNFFNPAKDGKDVPKEIDDGKRDLVTFFKMYTRNLSRLLTINAYIIFGNFPIFFGMFALGGYVNRHTSAPASQYLPQLYGVLKISGNSPVISALYGVHVTQTALSVNTTASLVLFALTGLVILTWGYVNVGTTYLLRNMIKREPVFMWYDFWYAIKHNLRQGMIVGILDIVFMALLAYDVVFFYYNIGPFLNNVMFYFSLAVAVIYFLMRFYLYLLMVTFNLKLWQIFKNALIFAMLGFKRNALAFIGIALVVLVNYALFLMYIPLGIIMPFLITFGTGVFIAAYAAYPKIKEIMIDPYETPDDTPAEEPIFLDRG